MSPKALAFPFQRHKERIIFHGGRNNVYNLFCLGWPPSWPTEDMETSIELPWKGSSVHLNQGNPASREYLETFSFGKTSGWSLVQEKTHNPLAPANSGMEQEGGWSQGIWGSTARPYFKIIIKITHSRERYNNTAWKCHQHPRGRDQERYSARDSEQWRPPP